MLYQSHVIRLIFLTTFSSLIFKSSYCQERIDEEMPKLSGSPKSITNLKGWAKNDIGKWYDFNAKGSRDETLKIDIAKISYENEQYLCVAVFTKSYYIRANVKHFEYCAFFWLLDTTRFQDLKNTDSSIHTRLYPNILNASESSLSSSLIGYYQPVTWSEILKQIKRNFRRTYRHDLDSAFRKRKEEQNHYNTSHPANIDPSYDPYKSFFIRYRFDNKLNKAQFFIGTIDYDSDTQDLGYSNYFIGQGNVIVTTTSKNDIFGNRYFEVPKNLFELIFKQIIH